MSSIDPRVLDEIVKAYDVRGTVPDQINTEVSYALGVGFARFCSTSRILVARDMRPSGSELVEAFSRGVMEQGIDVVDLGLASTDLMYYAAGTLDAPGAMFTASHNPAGYNGVKFCLSGARPVGVDTGLDVVKQVAVDVLSGRAPVHAATSGSLTHRNLLEAFADHVVSFIDVAALRPLRVVADTANGMGGLVVPAVFERLPQITLEVMYGELDGTFPNHPADPLQPANQRDLQARVVAGGFDIGLAFDGDADRVFVVDE
ncbi:MAG TPA: phosphomannomutase/phosphoglucomutase, partial [Ilumatobacteraceae bacterium]|nr:phosphomannomutase/phosphoglucomutase [Ilumatobacteraceae bacterium]